MDINFDARSFQMGGLKNHQLVMGVGYLYFCHCQLTSANGELAVWGPVWIPDLMKGIFVTTGVPLMQKSRWPPRLPNHQFTPLEHNVMEVWMFFPLQVGDFEVPECTCKSVPMVFVDFVVFSNKF